MCGMTFKLPGNLPNINIITPRPTPSVADSDHPTAEEMEEANAYINERFANRQLVPETLSEILSVLGEMGFNPLDIKVYYDEDSGKLVIALKDGKEMETYKDILDEMRSRPLSWLYPQCIPQAEHDNDILEDYARRLTEAIDREVESIRRKERE